MFKIIIDYGSDGWKFDDEEYLTIDSAIKAAIRGAYGCNFLIVKIIEWEAIQFN